MTKKLNQLIAIEKSFKSEAGSVLTEIYQSVQKPPLFTGIAKTYRPKNEDGDKLPSEGTKVQLRVKELIAEVNRSQTELFNAVGAKDRTNCVAKASVVVDGQVLVKDVPATHLLWLEKQVLDLKTFISKLPLLDPTETWAWDANQNCYATPPVETVRTKKVEDYKVVVQATKEHPAQIAKVTNDQLEGYWTTVKFSGAMPAQEQKELLERVEKLQRAIKTAREEANLEPVQPLDSGSVLEYVFRRSTS